MNLNVSEEAVSSLLSLASRISELREALQHSLEELGACWEENQIGLGAHSESIGELIEHLSVQARGLKETQKLCRRLRMSAEIRNEHIRRDLGSAKQSPQSAYIAGVMGRIYASGVRNLVKPGVNGAWSGQVFHPNPSCVPAKSNPEGLTFAEIYARLEQEYGIHYTGTPFVEGFPDFSGVSLASVGREEIIALHVRDGRSPDPLTDGGAVNYYDIFRLRSVNFRYADEILVARQVPLPGLRPGYSRDDVEEWRNIRGFTWEESPIFDYLLVPAVIHGNIAHTGLVALETHTDEAERNIISRLNSMSDVE